MRHFITRGGVIVFTFLLLAACSSPPPPTIVANIAATALPTATPTATLTPVPTATQTPSATPTPTNTPTPTPTPNPLNVEWMRQQSLSGQRSHDRAGVGRPAPITGSTSRRINRTATRTTGC